LMTVDTTNKTIWLLLIHTSLWDVPSWWIPKMKGNASALALSIL
jgi:hypothetical protein